MQALDYNPHKYLKYLKCTNEYNKKIIHNIAEYIIKKYNDPNKLYDISISILNNALNHIFINPISLIVIDYTNQFGIIYIEKTIELYLICTDNNLADIILVNLFPCDRIELKLPELKSTPRGTIFNGTNIVLYNERKLKYITNNVVCVIYFDMPDDYPIYCADNNYEYHVLVITYDGTTIIPYTVHEDCIFKAYKTPIYNDGAFYSYYEDVLALDFEYIIKTH